MTVYNRDGQPAKTVILQVAQGVPVCTPGIEATAEEPSSDTPKAAPPARESGATTEAPSEPKSPEPVPKKRARKRKRPPLLESADSLENHNKFTHYPKHPQCPICNQSEAQYKQCRKSSANANAKTEAEVMPSPKTFSDAITLDHITLGKHEDASRTGDRVACVILHMYSRWLQAYPAIEKSARETRKSIVRFLGPQVAPKYIYSENSEEIKKAIQELHWDDRHDTSTPYKPATSGIVERTARDVKEGTCAALIQSGANPEWWADAMRYYSTVRNFTDKQTEIGKTPYEQRFNNKFNGPVYPFGCEIEYKPSSPTILNEMHPLGSK